MSDIGRYGKVKPRFYNDEKFVSLDVIDDIKADLWMAGVNMAGEYQGVWVRFKEIDRIFSEHLAKIGV